MALPRKNNRSIAIHGNIFQWTVSAKAQPQTGTLRLFIKSEQAQDKGIVIYVPCRDPWLDISDRDKNGVELDPSNYRPVKPSDVRAIIAMALITGWQSGSTVKPLVFDYDWKQLTLRDA